MAWTYDPSVLDTTTGPGRLNSVRLLVGDTDTNDQQIQNEEIDFSILQTNTNIYNAAAFVCRLIAAKYARLVTTQLDGALQAEYSDRVKHYTMLSLQMADFGKKVSGRALGVFGGGISIAEVESVQENTDRVPSQFRVDQFNIPGNTFIPEVT